MYLYIKNLYLPFQNISLFNKAYYTNVDISEKNQTFRPCSLDVSSYIVGFLYQQFKLYLQLIFLITSVNFPGTMGTTMHLWRSIKYNFGCWLFPPIIWFKRPSPCLPAWTCVLLQAKLPCKRSGSGF